MGVKTTAGSSGKERNKDEKNRFTEKIVSGSVLSAQCAAERRRRKESKNFLIHKESGKQRSEACFIKIAYLKLFQSTTIRSSGAADGIAGSHEKYRYGIYETGSEGNEKTNSGMYIDTGNAYRYAAGQRFCSIRRWSVWILFLQYHGCRF